MRSDKHTTCIRVRRAAGLACIAAGVLASTTSLAQDRYPSRVVRLAVGFSPGGAVDVSARIVMQKVSEFLGQQVLVENRPGADGILAGDFVAKAAPDGHTLGYVSAGHTMNPATKGKSLPYHPLKSFAPVSLVAVGAQVLVVNPSVPARNVKELVELARKRPGQITFASSGTGGPTHLAAELLKSMAKIDMVHVPYKGGAPALNDVISGQLELTFIGAPAALPHVRSGRLRLLAVTTPKRMSTMPDVPTVAEQGVKDFDVSSWYGICGQSGIQKPVFDKLRTDLLAALARPETKKRLTDQGIEPKTTTPEEFVKFVNMEMTRWARVVKAAKIPDQ